MIATLPSWANDTIDAIPLLVFIGAVLGWIARRWRAWMTTHVVGPISEVAHLVEYHLGPNSGAPKMVDRVIANAQQLDAISNRVEVLEIVHHTEGVTANEVTALLIEREQNKP